MLSIRRAVLISLAIASIPLEGCAASPPPAAPFSEPPPASFATGAKETSPVDAEMLKIASAEDQIDRLFPHAGGERSNQKSPAKKAAPPTDDGKQAAPMASGEESCAIACKALASMKSSAEQLCKLSGEGDGRCEDARGRVRGASARVKSVCPTCSAAAQP
jgi:hypothetical protein